MKTYSVGLVGVGKIAVDQHLPSLEKSDRFRLTGLVSLRGVTHGGLPSYRSLGELLAAQPDLDAVSICTPPDVRPAIVREALRAGKHVMMEKPPTATIAELADLESEAARAGRTLFATWHSQYNPAVDEAKRRLASSAVDSLVVEWKEDVKRWHPGQDWVWQPGGFGVFDPGINALSILTKILPFPLFVASSELEFPANRDTPIGASIVFTTSDPAPSRLTADFDWRQVGGEIWTITIRLEDGSELKLTHGGTRLFVDGKPLIEEGDQEYPRIYARFAELLDAGASDIDAAPLRIVADSFLMGRRREVEAFDW